LGGERGFITFGRGLNKKTPQHALVILRGRFTIGKGRRAVKQSAGKSVGSLGHKEKKNAPLSLKKGRKGIAGKKKVETGDSRVNT